MDEKQEALIDEILLNELDVDKYKKVNISLLLVIHRQLLTLSKHTDIAVEDMNREFIIENLGNVKVTDEVRKKVKSALAKKITPPR